MADDVHFSRVSRTGEALSEFRCNFPRAMLEVLDMLAISESKSRGEFVSRREVGERIITEYLQKEIDKAILIHGVISQNPTVADNK